MCVCVGGGGPVVCRWGTLIEQKRIVAVTKQPCSEMQPFLASLSLHSNPVCGDAVVHVNDDMLIW